MRGGSGIGATNAFLSTSTALIAATGTDAPRFIAPDTPFRQKIESLLSQGNINSRRYAWGVYEDRMFVVTEWAGAAIMGWVGAPANYVTYQRFIGDATVYDAYGGAVPPWNVRPDRMYQTVELLDTGPVTTAADAASRFYVERVTFSIDANGTSVRLEPQAADDLDSILARS